MLAEIMTRGDLTRGALVVLVVEQEKDMMVPRPEREDVVSCSYSELTCRPWQPPHNNDNDLDGTPQNLSQRGRNTAGSHLQGSTTTLTSFSHCALKLLLPRSHFNLA